MGGLQYEKCDVFPTISIGIVVYNGIEHIRRALESVVIQSYKNIELIVVDGGSSDGTQDVLNEYAAHISVLVSEPDKGIYDAMNKVCSLATGDWLIFLGCDDVLLDTIGKTAALLISPDTVYHGDVIKRTSGNIYGGKFSKYRLIRYNFCHQALFYPRKVYKKYSYNIDYRWLADYAYNLRLVGDATPFVYTGVVVSIFNDEGRSASGDADFGRDRMKMIRSTLGNSYALIELFRIWKDGASMTDKFVNAIGPALKFLLPYSFWKYFQALWRRMRRKY
ncbi:MAG: glycosyltransferase family 2 protein [Gallionella sp.]